MFAVYASEPNADDPIASLVVGERPDPDVPEGWVRVKVEAASLNMHDLWTLRGVGIKEDQFPMILGCDGAGTLDDGTPVVLHSLMGDPDWKDDETLDPKRKMLTEWAQGSFADYVVVPQRNALPRPEGMTASTGAVMGTAWLTAYRMLFTKSGLRGGQTMLVQGASGGVSTALIQLGRAAGMQVWVTGRTDEKRELALRLGAHQVFESNAKLPGKVQAVFETVGEATWKHSLRALVPGGTIVCSGATSGNAPQRRPRPGLLPAEERRRLDDGHARRAPRPARVRRGHRHRPGDRPGDPDGRREGRVPGDARRRHGRQDRLHALTPCERSSRL